jgi:hypothetical protein
MGSISRYLLTSFVLSFIVPLGGATAQSPTVKVETDYLMTLELSCEPGRPMGQKLVVNCPGGLGPWTKDKWDGNFTYRRLDYSRF